MEGCHVNKYFYIKDQVCYKSLTYYYIFKNSFLTDAPPHIACNVSAVRRIWNCIFKDKKIPGSTVDGYLTKSLVKLIVWYYLFLGNLLSCFYWQFCKHFYIKEHDFGA